MRTEVKSITKQLEIMVYYFVICVVIALIIIGVGPIPQMAFAQDFFFLLDGGARLFRGLHMYQDFEVLVGPIPFLEVALGIGVEGPVARALSTASGIDFSVLVLAVWFLYLRWEKSYSGLALALLICLIWCAPFPIHYEYYQTDYAMFYNRQCFSLYCLALLMISSKRGIPFFSLGLVVGTMFFIKLPAGLSCALLCLLGFSRSPSLQSIIKFMIGLSLIAIPFVFYIQMQGLIDSIVSINKSGHMQGALWFERFKTVSWDLVPGVALAPLCWILLKNRVYTWFGLASESLAFLAGAILSDIGNNPFAKTSELPPLIFYGLFLFLKIPPQVSLLKKWELFLASVSCAIVTLPAYLRYLLSIGFILHNFLEPIPLGGNSVINSDGFRDIRFYGFMGVYPGRTTFADKVNDGLDLILKHPELTDKKIATLDFSDFFSYVRHQISPDHMPPCIQYEFNLDENYQPNVQFILTGCSGVMVPKYPNAPAQGARIMAQKYSSYLNNHFSKKDESLFWVLYYN